MASSAASSTNALLALTNQQGTENDQVPFDDAGGPRNDGAPSARICSRLRGFQALMLL